MEHQPKLIDIVIFDNSPCIVLRGALIKFSEGTTRRKIDTFLYEVFYRSKRKTVFLNSKNDWESSSRREFDNLIEYCEENLIPWIWLKHDKNI